MRSERLFDHIACRLSELDLRMVQSVPPGGNWQNIPSTIPSKRIEQIRAMAKERGGVVRTTYYGRLRWDEPSYTISTYFNRPGNGCNIHPSQDRTLSIREAARLQSFPDGVRFSGSQGARRKQIGNAVPPLMARAVGALFPPGRVVDLFAGAGGLSLGLSLAGHQITVATDSDENSLAVLATSHPVARIIHGDLEESAVQAEVVKAGCRPDIVVGGPPCQGWSFAGWFKKNDPRNAFVWTFINVVRELKPSAFVMENVEGLVWMGKGEALKAIQNAFREAGFNVTHFVLNAADFGVPQRRKRIFVVGVRTGSPPSQPAGMFGFRNLFLPSPITVAEAIADLPRLAPGQGSDEVNWNPPNPLSAYQEWVRNRISFDEMYHAYRNEKPRTGRPLTAAPRSICLTD